MRLHRLVHQVRQIGRVNENVLLRILRPGVKERPFHMGSDLVQFRLQLSPGVCPAPPGHQAGSGDGGFDLMDPAFHVFPIVPLSRLGL